MAWESLRLAAAFLAARVNASGGKLSWVPILQTGQFRFGSPTSYIEASCQILQINGKIPNPHKLLLGPSIVSTSPWAGVAGGSVLSVLRHDL